MKSESTVRRKSLIALSGLVPGVVTVGALATSATAAEAVPGIHMIALPTGSAGTGSADSGSADSGSAGTGSATGSSQAAPGIPMMAETAYKVAALELSVEQPQCHMPWQVLAGIGRVESHHADNGDVDMFGTTRRAIYGPSLNGTLPGNEVVRTTSGKFLRAEGPMQFMPATWGRYARPGGNPQNLFDATYAAGNYLCSGGLDMRNEAQRTRAILRYNHSMAYVAEVMGWANRYH